VTQLTGGFAGSDDGPVLPRYSQPPTVIYAGRFIPEKRIELLVEALALVRESIPGLRARLIGSGPTRDAVIARISALSLDAIVDCPGFLPTDAVDKAIREAVCVVQPSSREGYGMVVVEASACGVPAVVIAGEDNAASELVEDGRNGFVVPQPDPALLAEAIVKCGSGKEALRRETLSWYRQNRDRLSSESSLRAVIRDYG
jgi:glycosyltransferase involved in cell wall biosynthesis